MNVWKILVERRSTESGNKAKDAFSLVLIVVLVKNGIFAWFQLVCDRRTDGPTDGRTDRRTDIPSYRDARTHLKKQ